MDIFGLKARKENEYLAKCLMKDKEALYKAKNLIQLQQEIDYLKMINNMKVDYPNSKKS